MAKGSLLYPSQRGWQAVDRNWRFRAARRFESCRAYVNGEEKEEKVAAPATLREDGITFLSREELDDYREQQVTLAWQEGAYV